VNFDNMQVNTDSNASSDDANLAFQLFDDEVMDAKMANFIGIHMLNDIIDTGMPGGDADFNNNYEEIDH
jgi:hypothetical protein